MKRALVAVAVLAILGIGFLLIADPVFDLDFGLIRVQETSATEAVLAEARSVFALSTVEFVYKTVFPHDFVPEKMSWGLFLRQRQDGRVLSPLEEDYFRAYELCRDIGIDLQKTNYDFVVVTTIVRGGFDLKGSVFVAGGSSAAAPPALLREYVWIDESGTAHVRPPKTTITELIIDDSRSSDYGYPDMDISPENWRAITSFVADKILVRVVEDGILAMALENGKRFLRSLLAEAGFPEVVFFDD